MAATNPAKSERIARGPHVSQLQEPALEQVAKVVAATDPARAEQIARTILQPCLKASALLAVAQAISARTE